MPYSTEPQPLLSSDTGLYDYAFTWDTDPGCVRTQEKASGSIASHLCSFESQDLSFLVLLAVAAASWEGKLYARVFSKAVEQMPHV